MLVSLLLLLIVSSAEFAIFGYLQAQADGASLIGARTIATGNTSTDATNAIQAVFPKIIASGSFQALTGLVSGENVTGADVSVAGPTFHVPFGPTLLGTLRSHTYESTPATMATPDPTTGDFTIPVVCARITIGGIDTPIYLAQDPSFDNRSTGTNTYGEFKTHQDMYDQIGALLSPQPSTVAAYKTAVASAETKLSSIYAKDATTTCPVGS